MTRFVRIAHPDIEGEGTCPLSALDHYRQAGWFPLDSEHQTPTEAVQQRVRELAGHDPDCQMLKPVPPGFLFDSFSCNCLGPDRADTP